MAGLGSAFGGAFEDSIDKSKKRRSTNMEAFNSFVKMHRYRCSFRRWDLFFNVSNVKE